MASRRGCCGARAEDRCGGEGADPRQRSTREPRASGGVESSGVDGVELATDDARCCRRWRQVDGSSRSDLAHRSGDALGRGRGPAGKECQRGIPMRCLCCLCLNPCRRLRCTRSIPAFVACWQCWPLSNNTEEWECSGQYPGTPITVTKKPTPRCGKTCCDETKPENQVFCESQRKMARFCQR